jgi:quercetin dioxygenase-like cupin family protein
MKADDFGLRATVIRCMLISAALLTFGASAEEQPTNELPRSSEINGIKPEVLVRAAVPGAPGKIAMATRVTYESGARIRKHYHTSQVVFYVLEGEMVVQDEGRAPFTLKAGDSLLIKPGTIHSHWNASTTAKLVFTEFILVDEGQRSAVFVE